MKKFYNKLVEAKVSPNQLYILYCIRHNMQAMFVNIFVELRSLRVLGYLDKGNTLTDKALELLKESEEFMIPSLENKNPIDTDYLEEYYQMWPRIKLPTGKYARSDKKNLQAAFKWFFKKYGYSWNVVIQATAMYLDEYEAKGWSYMRTSQYFIRKDETSELADYCGMIESGEDPDADNKNHFPDKVV
jgi:hypothetical protein